MNRIPALGWQKQVDLWDRGLVCRGKLVSKNKNKKEGEKKRKKENKREHNSVWRHARNRWESMTLKCNDKKISTYEANDTTRDLIS